jgi:hypothetical protein
MTLPLALIKLELMTPPLALKKAKFMTLPLALIKLELAKVSWVYNKPMLRLGLSLCLGID